MRKKLVEFGGLPHDRLQSDGKMTPRTEHADLGSIVWWKNGVYAACCFPESRHRSPPHAKKCRKIPKYLVKYLLQHTVSKFSVSSSACTSARVSHAIVCHCLSLQWKLDTQWKQRDEYDHLRCWHVGTYSECRAYRIEVCGSTRTRGYGSGTGRCLAGRAGMGTKSTGTGIPVFTRKEHNFYDVGAISNVFFIYFFFLKYYLQ